MLRILEKRVSGGVFDPDDVRILAQAFDPAWKAVCDSGTRFSRLVTLKPPGRRLSSF
jgi:hypothetical protein